MRAFVKLECKTEYHGVYGQQLILECIVKPVVVDVTIITVTWKRMGAAAANLLEYHKEKMDLTPGFKFAEPSWNKKNMNVSLLLTNTNMADKGEYECMVTTDVGIATATTSLSVTAKYKTPTMSSIPETNIKENTDVTIFCNSTGGHQKWLIWWFDQFGTNWTRSAELVAKETDDGLFSLSSKFTVLKATSSYRNYTCEVLNVNGAKEGMASFVIPFVSRGEGRKGDNVDIVSTTKWLIPVVAIGSLIIILLAALLFFKRCSAQRGYQTDTRHDQDVEAEGLNSNRN
uniref:Ig-like domain-containing protein n=1 Tax=Hucho hucho TaxID=62062 RepID=A0A4W5MFG2_9TELE